MIDQIGHEQGGCCLSVSLRDYARVGQFILDGAKINGKSIVPDEWIETATHKQADIGQPGAGYGYQWWTNDDGTFDARGIFGQFIHFDPARKLVVVINSAWPVATGRAQSAARTAFIKSVLAAVDGEAGAGR
jgi:CubicO group peptidase (beta-lactamase class C family)